MIVVMISDVQLIEMLPFKEATANFEHHLHSMSWMHHQFSLQVAKDSCIK